MKNTFAMTILLLLISGKTVLGPQVMVNHELIDMNFYWSEYIKTHQLQSKFPSS